MCEQCGISKDNLLLRMTPDQWNDVIQVNLNGVFYMTKQVIRPMMKAKNGVIINMSSIIGEMGNAGKQVMLRQKRVSLVLQNQWRKN
jgi:3-oxoacyl-[acyl-carrier protein] reductase